MLEHCSSMLTALPRKLGQKTRGVRKAPAGQNVRCAAQFRGASTYWSDLTSLGRARLGGAYLAKVRLARGLVVVFVAWAALAMGYSATIWANPGQTKEAPPMRSPGLLFAQADQDEPSCTWDSDCGEGRVCRQQRCLSIEQWDEQKQANPQPSSASGSSGEHSNPDASRQSQQDHHDCGRDRRCRIERLKRNNRARRHLMYLKTERKLRDYRLARQTRQREQINRVGKAGMLDGQILTAFGGGTSIGLSAGWTLDGRIRPEIAWDYTINTLSEPESADSFFYANYEGYAVTLGASYLLSPGWFSPYFFGGFSVANGELSDSGFSDFGSFLETQNTRFHILHGEAGFDLQFAAGLRVRTGLAYRPAIFVEAKTDPGVYDERSEEGLKSWLRSGTSLSLRIALGWAFDL